MWGSLEFFVSRAIAHEWPRVLSEYGFEIESASESAEEATPPGGTVRVSGVKLCIGAEYRIPAGVERTDPSWCPVAGYYLIIGGFGPYVRYVVPVLTLQRTLLSLGLRVAPPNYELDEESLTDDWRGGDFKRFSSSLEACSQWPELFADAGFEPIPRKSPSAYGFCDGEIRARNCRLWIVPVQIPPPWTDTPDYEKGEAFAYVHYDPKRDATAIDQFLQLAMTKLKSVGPG